MTRIHAQLAATLLAVTNLGMTAASAEPLPAAGDGGVPAFYNWVSQAPATPGRLLRSEPLTAQQSLAQAGENYRILYSSTDGIDDHTPIVVSGALFLPKGTPPKGGWPLMAWAHGTVGSADVCAPSFAGRSQRDTDYLNHWLAQGYAIVATDYQGLGVSGQHPYGLTRPLSYGVLDSIRSVLLGKFDLSTRVVVFGQSQGARAAFATAVYAKDYAPELDIVGVVATGTPYASAKPSAAVTERTTAHSSVVPTFAYDMLRLGTAASMDPSFVPADYLNDNAMPAFKASQTACLGAIEHEIVANNVTFDNAFKRSPKAALSQVYRGGAYQTLKSDIPMFIGTGGKDLSVFTSEQVALVAAACKVGDRIEWHLYPELDHSATVNGSLPDSTQFVSKAFAGDNIEGNCGVTPAKG